MFTFVEIGLTLLGIVAAIYLVYLLFYSDRELLRKAERERRYPGRLDRREQERQDRRKHDEGAPDGVERRKGDRSRRGGD